MINEGAKILEEGKASRASDIDIVWLYGYGWPAYRGGPMFYADTLGLAAVIAGLKKYGIAPAPLLDKLVAAASGFPISALTRKSGPRRDRFDLQQELRPGQRRHHHQHGSRPGLAQHRGPEPWHRRGCLRARIRY